MPRNFIVLFALYSILSDL
uniref:Uncharacterized protein n=1 Tax=Rhizophora mucronata TaxID=61149 RepID=A0A2P2N480_RHIMU